MARQERKSAEGIAAAQEGAPQIETGAAFIVDLDGRILSSARSIDLLGYQVQDMVGKDFAVLFPLEVQEAGVPRRQYREALDRGMARWRGELLRRDGARTEGEILVVTLHDASGKPCAFSAVILAGSDEDRLDAGVMLERLFEHSPDAVLLVDREGRIRKINRQVEALFGRPREELAGSPLEILIPQRFHERHRHHIQDYFADPRTRKMGTGLQLFARRSDGTEFPVDIMLSPIGIDGGVWALAVVRDITERKRDEAKILELNEELKQQVEQLGIANRELEAFSYSVSHDLRAPVRHIGGYLQLLAKRDLSSLDAQSQRYLQVIMKAAEDMGTLIDDLLSFSRMGRVDLLETRVDMGDLVRDVVAGLSQDARDRQVQWEISPLPEVVGDPAMLRLVLQNLVSNALKFTRSREQAVIEIGAVTGERENSFFVRDNGVGFDMKYVDKMFGLFQRLHKQEEFEGTGVGLANVQRIVVRHGGKVWAEGALEGGATVWFSLPMKDAAR